MYWEEVIELIKKHGEEPESTFPNPYNESEDYEIYKYERGTLSTSYIHYVDFPENLQDFLNSSLVTFYNFQKNCTYNSLKQTFHI